MDGHYCDGHAFCVEFLLERFCPEGVCELGLRCEQHLMSEHSLGHTTGHTVALLGMHEASAECLVEIVTALVVNFFAIEFFDGARRNLC